MEKNGQKSGDTQVDVSEVRPPRLSPVELRNLTCINDPALEGFCVNGRRRGDIEETSYARPQVPERRFGHFGYEMRPDGMVRLATYEGDDGSVCIPAVIEGKAVCELRPNLFRDCAGLEVVSVDASSAYFSTDGKALFSKDGTRLLQLVVSCSEYTVPEGCREIGSHAFDSAQALKAVRLPSTLRRVGRLAFAKSGLCALCLPPSVEYVGEKAFYFCKDLEACDFPDGLREIGPEAFAATALSCVHLPATLARLGAGAFSRTPARQFRTGGGILVDASNRRLSIDGQGGLYRADEFVELLGAVSQYAIRPGTQRVASSACIRNEALAYIVVPEGVTEIGDDAFRGCRRLVRVDLPRSLVSIGARAFADTAVRELSLSENVHHLGVSALLVQGEGRRRACRRPVNLSLDARNASLYIESGLLCARGGGDAGGDACLLYVGLDSIVRIPERVNRITPYAFNGADGIDELFVHAHLHSVCRDAFSTVRSIPLIHVEFPAPVDGFSEGSFLVPALSARFNTLTDLIGTDAEGTTFNFAYYDAWVSNAGDVKVFAPAALYRLCKPMGLTPRAREVYLGIFARKQAQVCRYFAERGDLETLVFLCDAGVLGRECVEGELERASREGQAQKTACLLELRRRRAWGAGLDLSL